MVTIRLTKENLLNLYNEGFKFLGRKYFDETSPDVIYKLVLTKRGFFKLYRES